MSWNAKIKVTHLFTEDESHEAVQASMNAIADVLAGENVFTGFYIAKFRNIPEGDSVFGPVDYANKLINLMYDYADRCRIWIE